MKVYLLIITTMGMPGEGRMSHDNVVEYELNNTTLQECQENIAPKFDLTETFDRHGNPHRLTIDAECFDESARQ